MTSRREDSMSIDRDEGGSDRTVLCKKHVVGAHRRARRHRVCRYTHLLQRGTQVGGKRTDVLARAHQQDFDLIGFSKDLFEVRHRECVRMARLPAVDARRDRKSTRLNSSHVKISYAVFCLKKKIT